MTTISKIYNCTTACVEEMLPQDPLASSDLACKSIESGFCGLQAKRETLQSCKAACVKGFASYVSWKENCTDECSQQVVAKCTEVDSSTFYKCEELDLFNRDLPSLCYKECINSKFGANWYYSDMMKHEKMPGEVPHEIPEVEKQP